MRLAAAGQLERLRGAYEHESLTYEEIGATSGRLPAGYAHTRRRVRVGHGNHVFAAASQALLSWDVHRRSGLSVASAGPVSMDSTVALGLGYQLVLVIPCRVVYVVEEPRRRGFAYGTLPDHPEQGEESFIVSQDDDGTIWFEITVFSRPGGALIRYMGPLAKTIQAVWTRRYERALVASASSQT